MVAEVVDVVVEALVVVVVVVVDVVVVMVVLVVVVVVAVVVVEVVVVKVSIFHTGLIPNGKSNWSISVPCPAMPAAIVPLLAPSSYFITR